MVAGGRVFPNTHFLLGLKHNFRVTFILSKAIGVTFLLSAKRTAIENLCHMT